MKNDLLNNITNCPICGACFEQMHALSFCKNRFSHRDNMVALVRVPGVWNVIEFAYETDNYHLIFRKNKTLIFPISIVGNDVQFTINQYLPIVSKEQMDIKINRIRLFQ